MLNIPIWVFAVLCGLAAPTLIFIIVIGLFSVMNWFSDIISAKRRAKENENASECPYEIEKIKVERNKENEEK